eukprot:Gb_04880 [translate_table: standard]
MLVPYSQKLGCAHVNGKCWFCIEAKDCRTLACYPSRLPSGIATAAAHIRKYRQQSPRAFLRPHVQNPSKNGNADKEYTAAITSKFQRFKLFGANFGLFTCSSFPEAENFFLTSMSAEHACENGRSQYSGVLIFYIPNACYYITLPVHSSARSSREDNCSHQDEMMMSLQREPEQVISHRGGSVLGKKTILKSDHFPGCQNKRLRPQIEGAPNYRRSKTMD